MTTIEILNGLLTHHVQRGDAAIVADLVKLRNIYCEQIADPTDPGVAAVLTHRMAERAAQVAESRCECEECGISIPAGSFQCEPCEIEERDFLQRRHAERFLRGEA